MKKRMGVSRTTAKSKLELFVTKGFILDFALVIDTPLKETLLMIQASSSKTYF